MTADYGTSNIKNSVGYNGNSSSSSSVDNDRDVRSGSSSNSSNVCTNGGSGSFSAASVVVRAIMTAATAETKTASVVATVATTLKKACNGSKDTERRKNCHKRVQSHARDTHHHPRDTTLASTTLFRGYANWIIEGG